MDRATDGERQRGEITGCGGVGLDGVARGRRVAAGRNRDRVAGAGEFLRETDGTGHVKLPDFRYDQGGRAVRTAGLGFDAAQDGGPSVTGAETLGQSTREVLAYLGVSPELMDRLAKAGVLKGD